MDLHTFGVFTGARLVPDDVLAEAAALAEELGYGALWRGGSPSPSRLTPALEATDGLVVATGIVNVWSTPADVAAAEFAQLRERFGERPLLGVGIGHREATAEYQRPLTVMREYLDGLDAAPQPVAREQRCIAALGPKMLDLAAERTLGTHPYFVPVAHTRAARERLGAGPLIAVSVACVLDTDDERGRATARGYSELYLRLSNYANNLLRHGFTQDDIADGGSDRLIDAVVPHGSADQIAAVAREHVDAGADHVCLQVVGDSGVPRRQWTELAAALGL
ncbi:MAG TPA: TIGR03620 family F420-dependent LLM class oxidoreductase [Solirubrobacteraceae bacterium]|jgi:probable F420-dependent oxidoreductase|nr:TIGR03620 family F420-dependent LLM class oxidoreductase [Solirubrobacteraceae bacterium]